MFFCQEHESPLCFIIPFHIAVSLCACFLFVSASSRHLQMGDTPLPPIAEVELSNFCIGSCPGRRAFAAVKHIATTGSSIQCLDVPRVVDSSRSLTGSSDAGGLGRVGIGRERGMRL